MKALNIITTLLLLTSLFSCTDDSTADVIDFSGKYQGVATCTNSIGGTEMEATNLTIELQESNKYLLLFDDDVTFTAMQQDDVLTIEEQTYNAGGDFDVVTMQGNIRKTDSGILMEVVYMVDDEGQSTCTIPMTKL